MAAGLAGTVAMTVSERLEMSVSGRAPSTLPGQVGAKLLPGWDPSVASDVQQLNSGVHWVHGVSLGAVRGLLNSAGLTGIGATAAHFVLIWGGDVTLYRLLGIAPVPWEWDADELAADVLHKGVHAVVTGAVYDALT